MRVDILDRFGGSSVELKAAVTLGGDQMLDDSGHRKYNRLGLRLLLPLVDDIVAARELPPRTSKHRITKRRDAA